MRPGVLRRRSGSSLLLALLVVGAVAYALPAAWLFVSSLKRDSEYGTYPVRLLPETPIWRNYLDAVTVVPFFAYALRSFLLAAGFALLVVFSSAFVGFGFARQRVPWRNKLFVLVLAMIMVPSTVTIIPQFVLFARLGFVGTYWPWILGGLTGSPFLIFLFRQYFAAFPRELEDSAELDGANRLRTFWEIFLPNAKPVIATAAIFSFQGVWGDYLGPTLYLKADQGTLATALAGAYVDPRGNPLYTQTLAAIVLYVLPLIAIFAVAQKALVRGIVTTGMR